MNSIKKIIILLITVSLFPAFTLAQGEANIQERIVGSTFKTLAKAFVATADIHKLKADGIAKIKKMDEQKFRTRYAKAYAVMKDLPPQLKASYGINEDTGKEQVIRDIKSLDKQKIYRIIDAIPDRVIAGQFNLYLIETKDRFEKSDVVAQINRLWDKIIGKVKFPR